MPEKLRNYVSQCSGKMKFDSRHNARKASSRMNRRKKKPVEAYRCPHCGFYHLGTSSNR